MLSNTQNFVLNTVRNEIELHPSWLGHVSGLKAEKLLRNRKQPYLFVLRSGEHEDEFDTDYYITFIDSDLSIKHQPFVITVAPEGWYYENGNSGGPFTNDISIEEVLHLIMHCHKDQCTPLINFRR